MKYFIRHDFDTLSAIQVGVAMTSHAAFMEAELNLFVSRILTHLH